MQQNELHHPLPQFKSCIWNWDCVSPTSIVFCCYINHHDWKTTSTSILVNVQLQKIVLKKISLNWWTTRSLISLLDVFLFFYIDSFIAGKDFILVIVRSYVFIDSFIVGKVFSLSLICSFILIHSLQVKFFLYDYLFLCIHRFIHSR